MVVIVASSNYHKKIQELILDVSTPASASMNQTVMPALMVHAVLMGKEGTGYRN